MAKISFIINSFSIGGIERVIISLVNSLSQYHNVELVVLKNKGELKETLNAKVKVIDLGDIRVKNLVKPSSQYLLSEKPDFLVTSIYQISVLAYLSLLFCNSKTKLIVTHHALFDLEFQKNKVKDFCTKKIISHFYNKAYKVLAVSISVSDFLRDLGVKNVEVMYNPIDIAEKKINAEKEQVAAEQLNNYFLYLGRLAPVKNISLIIKAFSIFLRKNSTNKEKLVIIGSGPDEEKLKLLVKELELEEKVLFLGSKSFPEAYIKNAKLVLMASFSEAMPVTVMEAFIFNRPLVSTPAKGCLDIFNLLGYRYHTEKFDDPEEYANLMSLLLIKENDFSNLSELVTVNYGTDIIISKWNEILS